MLNIIISAIDNACGNDGKQRLYPDDSYLASKILSCLEEAGMSPPSRMPSEKEWNKQDRIGYELALDHGYYEYTWEPENE